MLVSLCVGPATNWQPIRCVPHLLPHNSWEAVKNEWMD